MISDNLRGVFDNVIVQTTPQNITFDSTGKISTTAWRISLPAISRPGPPAADAMRSTATVGSTTLDTVNYGLTQSARRLRCISMYRQRLRQPAASAASCSTSMPPTISNSASLDVTGQIGAHSGHVYPCCGWVIEASVAKTLVSNTDYAIGRFSKDHRQRDGERRLRTLVEL